jgi:prevent-host-death family protein
MDHISLFEAKAHFSEIIREVSEYGREVLITVRGKPKAKIIPFHLEEHQDAWKARESHIAALGELDDFDLPPRDAEMPRDPLRGEL